MKYIILIILITVTFSGKAQSDFQEGPDGYVSSYMLFYGGVRFKPMDYRSNKPDTVLCRTFEENFYINGIQLNKEQFLQLGLSTKNLANHSINIFGSGNSRYGFGKYTYIFHDMKDCVCRVDYQLEVNIPIILNNSKLNKDRQVEILSKIGPSEILSVKRNKFLFGKGNIHIVTKSFLGGGG